MNAAKQLESRQWVYCKKTMFWMKANPKKDKKGKSVGKDDNLSVIVFNPMLWKEEVVMLLED